MTTVNRYDFIQLKAEVSPEGFIRDKPVITRAGIFTYRQKDGRTIKEYRSPEEVFKSDSLATLAGVPITDGHRGMVNSDNPNGILGAVLGPGEQDGDNVVAGIIIHNPKKLGKRRELSLGYHADILDTPGVTSDGHNYDSIQTNIRYNHLAVVEKGRAGNARLRLDASDGVNGTFEEDEVAEPKMVIVKIDDIEYTVSPEVARHVGKLQEEVQQRTVGYDTLAAERDSLKGQVAEHVEALKTAVLDAKNELRARLVLEEQAKKHNVVFDDKTTDRKLREDIVTKLRGNVMKFDGKSDEYVNSAFDLTINAEDNKQTKVGNQRQQAGPKSSAPELTGAAAARAKMIANIRVGRTA
jgi:uncharacterized protein